MRKYFRIINFIIFLRPYSRWFTRFLFIIISPFKANRLLWCYGQRQYVTITVYICPDKKWFSSSLYDIYSKLTVSDFSVVAMSSKDRGGFVCDICQASFVSLWNLKRHLTAHQGLKFSCDICGAKFGYQFSLVRHTASQHRTTETFRQDTDPKSRARFTGVKPLAAPKGGDTALSSFQKAVSIIIFYFLIQKFSICVRIFCRNTTC